MQGSRSLALFSLGCLVIMMMVGSTSAMFHVVGAREGWDVPPNVTYYRDWAKPRTFGVGDRLIFPYRPGSNNLLLVHEKDYQTCSQENFIETYYMGPTIYNLTTAGDLYFICSIGKHCESGQKLHIKVVNAPGSSGVAFPFQLGSRKLLEATNTVPRP